MKVKSEREVTQSCQILRDPMDCSLPGSSVHGVFQARVLERGAVAFSMWITTNWKILKAMGIPDHLTCLLRNLYVGQEELDMEQWTGSKLGKEYINAVYCHLAYLTYMQSTSFEMPGWMKHKLESRLLGLGTHVHLWLIHVNV